MKKNPGAFVSDTRNVGGRQHVIETMLSHQSKLRAIVSDTRSGKARAATSFSSAPATFNLSRKISAQKARKQGRQLNEQEKADQNMLRRMDTYPLPGQRRQNANDPTAHPVKLFRDANNPGLYSSSTGGANGPLALPASPRRLYSSSPLSPRSTGLAPQTNTGHTQYSVFRPDHFASALPRSASAHSQHGHYKRAALEIMEYTQGKPVTRRAIPTDSDEIVPGSVSPRSMRRRPASAFPRGSAPPAGQNRDGSWRPLSATTNPNYARFAEDAADDFEALADGSCPTGSTDPYTKLKDKLFALIVEHRIFREKAILKLLQKAKQINSHMNQLKLDRVLEEIKIEFEINPMARLEDEEPSRNTARMDRERDLDAKRRELRDLELDLQEERLTGKLESQQRALDDRDARERGRSRSRSRSRDGSRASSRSRSGSRSRSRSNSPRHRNRSRSRSNSRSPRSRDPDSSRGGAREEEF